jgi:hypothetical protein
MNWTWLYVGLIYAAATELARRAGADLPRRIAFFFYALVLIFFFRPLTGPYINFQVDVLPSISPWAFMTDDHHQYTPELNDLPMQIVPWMQQVRESWKSFQPPIWNHYSASGYPLLGNGQSSALSVLHFLTLPLSIGRAVTAEGAMKVLIALTFTFLYCRRRYSLLASTFAAVSFAFGGFIVGWLHFPMVTAACLAPGVLYAIDLLAERRTFGRFLFAALLWTQLHFAGHPETTAHIVWLGAVYTLWIVLAEKAPWRVIPTLCGALVVSALLAAPYLAPFLETVPKSKRVAELKIKPYDADALPNVDRNSAIVMFQPHFFGHVPWEKPWGPSDTEPLAGYPGVLGWVAWIAVAVHVVARGQWRSREAFLALTTLFIIGVIYSWPGPSEAFHFMMPVAAHARARLLFTLLCAIQVAAAIDYGRRAPLQIGIFAAAVAFFLLLRVPMGYAYRFDTAVLGMLPGMIVLLAATLVSTTKQQWPRWILLVCVVGELFHVGRDRAMPLPHRMLYPPTPIIRKLQALAAEQPKNQPFRFAGISAQFFPNLSVMYGLEDIRAHDPMSNARYLAFLKLTADYEPWNYFAFLNDPYKPVYDFLNVKYVVVNPYTALADPQRFAVVYNGKDGQILENRNVLPRFFAVRNILLERRLEVFYPTLRAHKDWANTVYLDRLNIENRLLFDDFFKPRPDDAPLATAKIVSASPTDYRLRVHAPRWSLVASSIPWWPGWIAEVNGEQLQRIRVNAVFLGFAVPPGDHDVRVRYVPVSFWGGVWLSLATVMAIVVVRVRHLRRSRTARGSV